MNKKQVRNGDFSVITRSFQIGKIRNADDRTVEAVISSEYPVPRYNGNEVLVHSTEAVDLSRAPLPLIVAHDDRTLPVGIVESLRIENKELHGVLRFSKSQDQVWNDIQDGILRSLSIGYITQRTESLDDGSYNVTRWQPYECSLVAAPADINAKIKRDLNQNNRSGNFMDVNDLKKTRKTAKEKMFELAKTRELTSEQKNDLAKVKEEVRTLTMQIEALEMDDIDDDTPQTRGTPKIELGATHRDTQEFKASKEYIRVYDKFLRFGKASLDSAEFRALTVGTDASMGYVVPTTFEKNMVKALDENNIMRSLCRVIKTDSDKKIPILTGHTTAAWIAENGTYNPSDPSVGQKTLEAHKLGVLCLASEELAYDAGFDLGSFLSEDFGKAMGDKEETAFLAGTGSGQPTGVLVDATVGKTTASATAITGDELLDLVHSLGRAYRKRAVFMMSDDTLLLLRKLKNTDGDYIYQESLKEGEPSKLLGRPVYFSESMPAPTAGNKAILFGDLSYYWIADRTGRFFQELRERYAELGQIGYKANQRVDGKLILPEAVQVLQMKAS